MYLTIGDSYQTIAFSFHVRRSTVGDIVKSVCTEISNMEMNSTDIYVNTDIEDMEAVGSWLNVWEVLTETYYWY